MTAEYKNLKTAIEHQNKGNYSQAIFHYLQVPFDVASQGLENIKTAVAANPKYNEVCDFIEDLHKKEGYNQAKNAMGHNLNIIQSSQAFEKAYSHFTTAKCAVGLLAIVLNSHSPQCSNAAIDTLNRWSN